MVFNILESFSQLLVNPKSTFLNDTLSRHLISEGFNTNEADSISWIINHRAYGEGFGILGGMGAAYAFRGRFKNLQLRYPNVLYNRFALPTMYFLTVLSGSLVGGYFANFKRQGANSWLSHFYVNIRYEKAKLQFFQNFEVLNRSFTQDEIKQFKHNGNLQTLGKKKYVYNPHLHTTEEEYRKEYERINSGKYILTKDTESSIAQQGHRKAEAGEKIVEKPYDSQKCLDISEKALGITNNQAFSRLHYLD